MKLVIAGQEVEILALDIEHGRVDWKRTTGYAGACVSVFSPAGISTWAASEAAATAAIQADLSAV